MSARAASARVDLPADDDDWITAPRGRSDSRLVSVSQAASALVCSPTTPSVAKAPATWSMRSGALSSARASSRSAALMGGTPGSSRRDSDGGLGVLGGQQHPAEFGLELSRVAAQLAGGRLDEAGARLGRVEVDRVDVEPLARRTP